MTTYLDDTLKRDMDIITKKIIKMGELVTNALKTSLKAFLERDRQLAYTVILRDQYIDELEKEIDQLCQEFLIRQIPAAGHFRFVYSVIKINNELERVGDYAESVARQVVRHHALFTLPNFIKFEELGNLSIKMFGEAIESFLKKDKDAAHSMIRNEKLEKQADILRYQIHDEILHLREKDKLPLAAIQPLMIVASRFERVANQAVNLCEETMFYCTGEDPKHKKGTTYNVLFVDETNTCRTLLAVGAGNTIEVKDFNFESAGLIQQETDQITRNFLLQKGVRISESPLVIKDSEDLKKYQIIIALSKKGEELFPEFPTKIVTLSWYIDDPSILKGTAAEIQTAYEKTYNFLHSQINDLVTAVLGEKSS